MLLFLKVVSSSKHENENSQSISNCAVYDVDDDVIKVFHFIYYFFFFLVS